ncbi:unnamed protein product [Effrenium voratum]|nr:unnamed protein product [Effrenium voratum]
MIWPQSVRIHVASHLDLDPVPRRHLRSCEDRRKFVLQLYLQESWTCDKRCRARDTQLHELDFKYHEQPCREIIPWMNGSTTQIDTDLWCAYPATRRCNMFFCNPQIECSNMYRHKPLAVLSSMTSCQASAAHKDFITQNCSWVCKHGRPVSRCQIHVDSSGAYGLQQNIKKCWVQETCNGRRGQKAVATCEPKAKLTAAPSVTLSGVMILTVAKAQEFLAQRHVDFALRDAISQMVPEPSYSKIVTEPRVETHNHLSGYSYPAVKVYFNISIPGGAHGPSTERAIATEMAFQNKSRSDLLNVVNGALSNQGLTDLALDALLDMNPLNFTDVHGPGSEEEFFEIVDTLRLYQKHLEQVQEELSDTSTDLQIQNLSQKDMAVVLAKHQSAQTRLSEILHAQSRVSKQIEDMIAQRNSTHKAFQRAQHAAQAAEVQSWRQP